MGRHRAGISPLPTSDTDMKRIVEQHLARLRKAQQEPEELDALRAALRAALPAADRAALRPVHQERIPAHAPDWYFEAELRRSGLWEMMERCYPSAAGAVAVDGRGPTAGGAPTARPARKPSDRRSRRRRRAAPASRS